MTLDEILKEVDMRVPNSVPDEMKIKWINAVIRQSYKDFPLPIKEHSELTVAGQNLYTLPIDCPNDRIEKVYVDESEYTYDPYNLEADYRSWKFNEGQIQIYPIPSTSEPLKLLYKPRPADLTIADMDNTPALPEDFHELLVVGCGIRVAKASNDYEKAGLLQAEYSQLYYNAALSGPKRKTVVVKRAWV